MQQGQGHQDAENFLKHLERDEKLKGEVRALSHIEELGRKHGYNFSNADLDRALQKKWGKPEKREEGEADPFTCCCI